MNFSVTKKQSTVVTQKLCFNLSDLYLKKNTPYFFYTLQLSKLDVILYDNKQFQYFALSMFESYVSVNTL